MKTPWRVILFSALFTLFVTAQLVSAAPLHQETYPPIFIFDLIPDPAKPTRPAIIELSDGGQGSTTLTGLTLLLYSMKTESVIAAHPLDAYQSDEEGFLQLHAGRDFASVNLTGTATPFDAILIVQNQADDFPPGTTVSSKALIDGIIFAPASATSRSIVAEAAFEITNLLEQSTGYIMAGTIPDRQGTIAVNATVPTNGTEPQRTNSTIPAPASATALQATIPANNGTIPTVGECNGTTTLIHEIQGTGESSPLNNSTVTIEGIVVGDFQDTRAELRGFFVQEEAADFDDDPATSEGIYVFDNGFGVDVAVGDRVQVSGQIAEFNTLTELKRISDVTICAHNETVEAVAVSFPLSDASEMEHYEGMLIRIESPMQVAQNYFLGRYGQITIVADGRAYQPTNLYTPGSEEALALAAENARRLLILDDGQDIRALGDNPNPVPYLGEPPDSIVRAGDSITNVVGVIDFGRIDSAPGSEVGLGYRLQPVEAPSFSVGNPRDSTPPAVGGTLKVASFNVLNYFNGNGSGGGYPTSRGAKSATEFERQRAKIIAALSAMNADVIGLMEIENDGYSAESAIQDLVNGLNDAMAGAGSNAQYAFVDPGLERLGADEIAVGILYNTTTVTTIGSAATLAIGAFDQELADFGRSRQPLAQSFADAQGEAFTLVVNHFKSKRPSGEPDESNIDHGDGAGSWNGRRTEAAADLLAWLATDPTNSSDPDFLVVGDLNAYAKEPPITTFEDAGYVNLIAHYGGSEAYSYVYDGQLGYLDHALASASLISQTTGAFDWHINADEAKVLDYGDQFNPPGYYQPDPFRASDHDPVLIGLTLGNQGSDDDEDEGSGEDNGEDAGDDDGAGEDGNGDDSSDEGDDSSDEGDDSGEEPIETAPINEELIHTVLPGETLSSIARHYSVSVDALAEANRLYRWSPIYANQQLTVPPTPEIVVCVRTIFSELGESFIALAERFGTDPHRLAFANGLATIEQSVDGQPICLPSIY